jgi:uncharacterized membrane protein
MVWVEHAASVVVETSPDHLYDVYVDLEAMPRWSPWLRRVERDAKDPMLSRWFLGARGFEFSWNARVVENEPGKIIRWVSETGLNNRGRVDFESVAQSDSKITLAIAVDVPQIVARAVKADFIGNFIQGTLAEDLKRFRNVALADKRKKRVSERSSGAPAERTGKD